MRIRVEQLSFLVCQECMSGLTSHDRQLLPSCMLGHLSVGGSGVEADVYLFTHLLARSDISILGCRALLFKYLADYMFHNPNDFNIPVEHAIRCSLFRSLQPPPAPVATLAPASSST